MSSTDNAVYLDLDAIVPEREIVVKLDKVEHKMVPVTLENFVKNMQTMEKLGTGNLDPATEQGMLVDMLNQVLPTIGVPRLMKLSLDQLNKLITFARELNGEKKIADEAKADVAQAAGANPQ